MLKPRTYKDREGLGIELLSLHLSYVYEGLIEGSRILANKFMRLKIEQELSRTDGLFIVGFPNIMQL